MKRADARRQISGSTSVLDIQNLPISNRDGQDLLPCQIEKIQKIVTLQSKETVLSEYLSVGFVGPQRPRRDDGEEDEDPTDVESELTDIGPKASIERSTPVPLIDHRPCDPVAKFLLSKC